VFAGRALELAGRDFWHYGGEVQHYWNLGGAPRVLSVRLYAEGVTGSLDDVPFFDLPALGGDVYLRGYGFDRFRDRIAAFGELQYRWDLSSYANVFVFVDSGRVYRDASELGVDHLRLGFGGGLALLSGGGHFLAEGMLGSSIDGGVVAALSFSPVEDRTWRFR
jgi:outer membrane protein assembly factor BamA